MMKEDKLRQIRYISVPEGLNTRLGDFTIDTKRKLPIQLSDGKKDIDESDYTVENIVSGMLTLIAYDEAHPDFQYYKSFINALEPGLVEKLNSAAIAKEQQKDYDFAEELFLAVYHLLPQSASCINLATLYSYMAVDAKEKKKEDEEDNYLLLAKQTLLDGIKRFGENESILAELASFEAYMGNLEDAKDYLDRYMAVASEGERKQELKKVLKQIDFQLKNDNEIKEAYDFIMLGMTEKALPIIERFVSSNPKIWNGYFLKGWALRIAKRYDGAKQALLECIKLGESNSEIYNELSLCELEGGNKELAITYLESAADLDPESLNILSNLAFLYLKDKDFDKAREYLEKARYLSGDDKLVKELIEQYEELTGEKIGELIHEEIIKDEDSDSDADDDGYAPELAEIENGGECECNCSEHHESNHSCNCHNHSHEHNKGKCNCKHKV